MTDKYYTYRPLLDLIGFTEGTDRKRGYNETLAYGAYTGGDVNLTMMTLNEIATLQAKMLKHPGNKWNSSAIGRYQIVSKTLRRIKSDLDLPGDELFNEEMQDRMGCFLLGVRGIDKYLSGRLKENTMINNLAREWASLPTTDDKGYYGGQHAAVGSARVREVLAEVKRRHREGQPVERVPVPKPMVPSQIDKEVKNKTNWFGNGLTLTGIIGAVWANIQSADWQTIAVFGGVVVIGLGITLALGPLIVRRIKMIRAQVESDV